MTLSTCAKLSRHAKRRSAQSNLSADDLELVRRYGVLEHRTGVLFYFVRKRDVERFRRVEPRLPMLQGVVLIMSNDDTIITIYRNSHALKDIRRKTKLKWHVAA
ncbi:MAG: hypothetical protein IVW55_03235 [Chloroflexi bacterium]|nr:hypothetical protein [Chloroflexota bacterium]